MIELRWVENRIGPDGRIEPNATVDHATRTYKVLQYRYAEEMNMSVVSVWSEWIDVPTVTE